MAFGHRFSGGCLYPDRSSAMVRVCLTACVYRVICERDGEGLFNGVCVPCYM
jgi:hypothetical protein